MLHQLRSRSFLLSLRPLSQAIKHRPRSLHRQSYFAQLPSESEQKYSHESFAIITKGRRYGRGDGKGRGRWEGGGGRGVGERGGDIGEELEGGRREEESRGERERGYGMGRGGRSGREREKGGDMGWGGEGDHLALSHSR